MRSQKHKNVHHANSINRGFQTIYVVSSFFVTSAAFLSLAGAGTANAADLPIAMPVKVPATSVYNWTGFYLGGHVGYGRGGFGPNTNPLPSESVFFPYSPTGLVSGLQAGYNLELLNHLVIGAEMDVSFTSPLDRTKLEPQPFNTTFDYFSTAKARVGYAVGQWLPYVTGGLAFGQTHININDNFGNVTSIPTKTHVGWTAGAGLELVLGGPWSARLDYTYVDLGAKIYNLDVLPSAPNVHPRIHNIKIGLNYRLWDTPPWMSGNANIQALELPQSTDWNVHGQATFVLQAYPRIRSPYEGASSLPGSGQTRQTSTMDAYLGWRLWQGGEFYFNPELAQGFGLNSTLGLGGFSNGEAQKGGTEYPKFRPQRYFLRQTFGLSSEQEDILDGPNQLPGKRDVDRITVTVGRFAVTDFFDGNSYAKDPRLDFMNWALWSSGAYDFPADLPGFTRGAVVELNRKDWAIRAGLFQVPSAPNSDVLTSSGSGGVVELEERYTVFDQPGKLRLGAFATRGNTANYRTAIATAEADPSLDINAVVASIRRNNPKHGFYVNAEQQIVKGIGIFGRVSWSDGQNEELSFTDIDRSVSGGVSVKGSYWGRPFDNIGIGGAINGLSAAHRDFLGAGGIGLLIGDGQINYGYEKILEAYYSYNLNKWSNLTFDYQYVVNPSYNVDRGPVSIFAARAHAEF